VFRAGDDTIEKLIDLFENLGVAGKAELRALHFFVSTLCTLNL